MGGAYGQKVDAIRAVTLEAGRAITPLLADERVAQRWAEPSALDRLSVGGLAGHLSRALETIEGYLAEPEPPDDQLLEADTYFAAALAMAGDLNSEMHRGVRERGEQAGSVGPAALVDEYRARLERVALLLEEEAAMRRVTVLRGAARMTLDDYLPTRLVEMVIHADDLAVSVGADLPVFEPEALSIVIDVLVGVARVTHGDVAVIRALARRERDDASALRVF
jgi:hypothetical protein